MFVNGVIKAGYVVDLDAFVWFEVECVVMECHGRFCHVCERNSWQKNTLNSHQTYSKATENYNTCIYLREHTYIILLAGVCNIAGPCQRLNDTQLIYDVQ